jgi:hypothetical protein
MELGYNLIKLSAFGHEGLFCQPPPSDPPFVMHMPKAEQFEQTLYNFGHETLTDANN